MWSLFYKELRQLFNSLTAYMVIIVFLLVNSLFIWVFPGQLNILDSGYASLDPLFVIAPWVFLLLIPAVCMRLFSEEKKNGTIELILTKPLMEWEIILAKYLAGLSLVLFSLLPGLFYFLTVYYLGNPIGNMDIGGTWGSFIGLFFLAAIYVAIGLFSSSLTDNQIVAFLVGMILSFFFYMGFEQLAGLLPLGKASFILNKFGIMPYYLHMSKGILDLRDVVYFISTIALFLFSTKIILQSRKW